MEMLTQPFLGGMFNYPILFGIQVYFWLFIVAILLAVGSELFWRFTFWEPLSPFHGLFKAWVDRTKATLVSDMNLDWALLSESAGTIIFNPSYYAFAIREMGWWIRFRVRLFKPDFSAAIAAQLEGKREEPTLITIGQIPTHIIIDTEWWTDRESIQRKAIIRTCSEWNENNPEDQVHRFSTFIRYVEEGKIERPEEVNLKKIIPWARIDAAFPPIRSDAAWGGFVRQIAEEMKGLEHTDLNKWAMIILAFGAFICIMMMVNNWFFK